MLLPTTGTVIQLNLLTGSTLQLVTEFGCTHCLHALANSQLKCVTLGTPPTEQMGCDPKLHAHQLH